MLSRRPSIYSLYLSVSLEQEIVIRRESKIKECAVIILNMYFIVHKFLYTYKDQM